MAKNYQLIINQATEYQSHHAAIKFVVCSRHPLKHWTGMILMKTQHITNLSVVQQYECLILGLLYVQMILNKL